jgi:hypothetical protein
MPKIYSCVLAVLRVKCLIASNNNFTNTAIDMEIIKPSPNTCKGISIADDMM